ncbi:MAG: ANTAR domain-containing protein [Clostridia bacterium]|nr:ANTAR domain-containing protein [Clostridia bacterium]
MNSIYLATDDTGLQQQIQKIMFRNGYQVTETANSAVKVVRDIRQRKFQLVILDYLLPGFNGLDIIDILSMEQMPIILVVNAWQTNFSELTRSGQVSFIMVKPITENNLMPAVESALASSQEIRRLKSELEELKKKMEARKSIDKAKGILMKSLDISEEEAFRRIQKQSMNQSMSMKSVADAIINSYKFLK